MAAFLFCVSKPNIFRLSGFSCPIQSFSLYSISIKLISCDQEEGALTKRLASRLRLSGFRQASLHSFLRTTSLGHMGWDRRSLFSRSIVQASLPGRWVRLWYHCYVAQLYRTAFYVMRDIPCRVTSVDDFTPRIFYFQLEHQVFCHRGSHCEGPLTKGLARRLSLCVSGQASLLFHWSVCRIFLILYDISGLWSMFSFWKSFQETELSFK